MISLLIFALAVAATMVVLAMISLAVRWLDSIWQHPVERQLPVIDPDRLELAERARRQMRLSVRPVERDRPQDTDPRVFAVYDWEDAGDFDSEGRGD